MGLYPPSQGKRGGFPRLHNFSGDRVSYELPVKDAKFHFLLMLPRPPNFFKVYSREIVADVRQSSNSPSQGIC